MMTFAAIFLIAQTVMYIPGNSNAPGLLIGPNGQSAIVQHSAAMTTIHYYAPGADCSLNAIGGYCKADKPAVGKIPMPKFKGDKKCCLCRGRGKLGRNDCKCVRKQQEAWKKDREAVLKANPQLKGSK